VRILLSFNWKDAAFPEVLRGGLFRIEPDAQIFFSLISLGGGFLLPKSTSREPKNGCQFAPGIYRLEVIVDDIAHTQQPLRVR
jgi:hypothetical protein